MTNNLGILWKKLKNNLVFGSVLVTAACIPINGIVCSISIIVMVISGLLLRQPNLKVGSQKINLISFSALFVFYLVGLLYSQDFECGKFEIEKKLSLIFIPLFFITIPAFEKRKVNKILDVNLAVCVILCAASLTISLIKFEAVGFNFSLFPEIFTNHNLSGNVGLHATYFSIYLVFAIVFLVEEKLIHSQFRKKAFYLGILFFLILNILLLASRIILFSYLIIIIIIFIRNLILQRKNKAIFLVIITTVVSSIFIFYLKDHYLRNRLAETLHIDPSNLIGNNKENGVTQRVFFWSNVIEIIKNAPFFGHGTGSASVEIGNQYNQLLRENPTILPGAKKAILYFKNNRYNCHNQYLEVLLSLGFAGLSILIFIIGNSFYRAWQKKDIIHFSFLFIMCLSFLTESVLERQMGITFFTFYNSLFFSEDS